MLNNIKRKILLFLGNPKLPDNFDIKKAKNFLLYPSAGIGDSIVFTPAIRNLKKKYPDSNIIVMTCKRNEAVFKQNPYISSIVPYSVRTFLKYRNKIDVFMDLNIFIREKTFILYRILNPKLLLTGYKESVLGLTEKDFSYYRNYKPPREQHTYKTFINYLDFLNVTDDGKGYDIFLKEDDVITADKFWEKGKIRILVNLFGAYKVLDKEGVLYLIRNIYDKFKNKVDFVLTWDEKTKEHIESVTACNSTVRLSYKTNVEQLFALVKTADLIISIDTGITHIASAFSKHQIAFYEQANILGWAPLNKESVTILCNTIPGFIGKKKLYKFDQEEALNKALESLRTIYDLP